MTSQAPRFVAKERAQAGGLALPFSTVNGAPMSKGPQPDKEATDMRKVIVATVVALGGTGLAFAIRSKMLAKGQTD